MTPINRHSPLSAWQHRQTHDDGTSWRDDWEAMARGDMPVPDSIRALIAAIVMEEVGHIYKESTVGEEARDVFHDVMENLRNMPQAEAARKLNHYFTDLTEEERKVALQLATRPSIARLASAIQMDPLRFAAIKMILPKKLK